MSKVKNLHKSLQDGKSQCLKLNCIFSIGLRSDSRLREYRRYSYKGQICCFKINGFKGNRSLYKCACLLFEQLTPTRRNASPFLLPQLLATLALQEESIKCLSQSCTHGIKSDTSPFRMLQEVIMSSVLMSDPRHSLN